MRLVSFDAMRSFGIPGVTYIRPDNWLNRLTDIQSADWLLFPEYDQVNALVYGMGRRVFPSIATYHLGHDKVQQTFALRAVCQGNLPETHILPRSDGALEWARQNLLFPLVGKEIRNSMGRGVHLLESPADLAAYAARTPVLYLQELLPIDRDLRLVVIGRKVVAGYWRVRAGGGFQTNVASGGVIDPSGVPPEAVSLTEAVALRLGIDHAGFDLAEVDGRFFFFEFNRLFGTRGLLEMNVQLGPLIFDYLASITVPPVTPSLDPTIRRAG